MTKIIYAVVLLFVTISYTSGEEKKLSFDDIFLGLAVSDSVNYEEFNVKEPSDKGVTVTSVMEESSCGNLINGDVIHRIDGKETKTMEDFDAAIEKFQE